MDFVQTMKDWRRMCETIQTKNQQDSGNGWCKGCPLQELCVIDTAVKDSTDSELFIIGDKIQAWAAEHPEPVYPSYLEVFGWGHKKTWAEIKDILANPIPADLAKKLNVEPKEVQDGTNQS